ncbi:synaptophysin-like protein 2 isoform X2 [Panulirus ornatus]
MKILQCGCSIFTFLTTASFSTTFSFLVVCETRTIDKNTYLIEERISYPFWIGSVQSDYELCDRNYEQLHLSGDFSTNAVFFVVVGVMALLYAVFTMGVYICFIHIYSTRTWVPALDWFVHAAFTVLWLAASIAWIKGLVGMQIATYVPTIMEEHIDICGVFECQSPKEPDFSLLYVSITFGFVNVFLWATNFAFLYKETCFYKNRMSFDAGAADSSVPV